MKLFTLSKTQWILIGIFLVGLFLRTYKLGEFPVGLHGDEASIGYNAYSLLKTGRDQNGNFLPIAIDQFGDFRPPGYHYLDIPFVALFGLTEVAVRLPSALFGAFSIVALYFLLSELFGVEMIALVGSGLLAILPWDINISRATSEGVIASFFITLGTYFFIRWIKNKKGSSIILVASLCLYVLSFFFYHAPRYFMLVFFPFLFLCTVISYRPSRVKMLLSAAAYGILLLSVFFFLSVGKGSGRVSEVSIFNIPGGTKQLKQAMDEEGTQSPLLTRFYDNKLFYFGRFFVTFYSQHLSGDFLFVNNGLPNRYAIPFTGNLYMVEAPFLLLGLAFLIAEGLKSKKYWYLIVVAWFFIAPIPAGLTWEDIPNIERSGLLIPACMMITAFGFYEVLLLTRKKTRMVYLVVCAALLLQGFLYFYHNYFWRLKIHEPWHRSASEKELIYTVADLAKKYPKVVMTTENNNNFIFYLFYTKFDPAAYQRLGSPREKDGLHFQNITYSYSSCPISGNPQENAHGNEDTLFVTKPDCVLPKNAETLSVIRTPDGIPSFQIVRLGSVQ